MTSGLTVAAQMRNCQSSALHLEMRDAYTQHDPMLDAWRQGQRQDAENPSPHWKPWLDLMSESTRRGVEILRARIISEPLSEYTRFEYDLTPVNVAYGEHVRWLPRRRATAIALPGNDFWLFDNTTLLINHFNGDGDPTEKELITDQEVIELCRNAFEAVWALATSHHEYRPF